MIAITTSSSMSVKGLPLRFMSGFLFSKTTGLPCVWRKRQMKNAVL
jgi:hypothetical protein